MDISLDCEGNLADLLYLVECMFNFGPPPPVIELADCNGNGSVDLADLLAIVDYLFDSGPPCVPLE